MRLLIVRIVCSWTHVYGRLPAANEFLVGEKPRIPSVIWWAWPHRDEYHHYHQRNSLSIVINLRFNDEATLRGRIQRVRCLSGIPTTLDDEQRNRRSKASYRRASYMFEARILPGSGLPGAPTPTNFSTEVERRLGNYHSLYICTCFASRYQCFGERSRWAAPRTKTERVPQR